MCKDCGDMKHKMMGTKTIVSEHNKKHRMQAIKKMMERMKK